VASIELAVSRVRSLFFGLPIQDKYMAVFIAASDETSGGHALTVFHYAGWIAPEPDWSQFFTPAWQEHVLDGPPKIPYLHMTDIRSRAWRQKHGIDETEADERLDEAARVIDQMGGMYPLNIMIDGAVFAPLYRGHKTVTTSGAVKSFQPDFLGFIAYAFGVLRYVSVKHPDAEKVDFLVENNSDITKYLHDLYKAMPDSLNRIGQPQLIPLIGKFLSGGKDRVPLQAADYLCWHCRRADSNTLDERDLRRFNTIANRKGARATIPAKLLYEISEAFAKEEQANGQAKRIQGVRQNNARSP
jgi:hypothetical protein